MSDKKDSVRGDIEKAFNYAIDNPIKTAGAGIGAAILGRYGARIGKKAAKNLYWAEEGRLARKKANTPEYKAYRDRERARERELASTKHKSDDDYYAHRDRLSREGTEDFYTNIAPGGPSAIGEEARRSLRGGERASAGGTAIGASAGVGGGAAIGSAIVDKMNEYEITPRRKKR